MDAQEGPTKALRLQRRQAAWLWAGLLLACALVFAAWLNPHLAVELATAVRSCF